jgi:hypothetical protein
MPITPKIDYRVMKLRMIVLGGGEPIVLWRFM